MLIGISTDQMKVNRMEGNPPPFTKEGGSIRYRVGDVRDYLKSKPVFKNDGEAHEYAKSQKNPGASYSAFMIEAKLDDVWPFTILDGKPIDLFASLSMPVTDDATCEWLTLERYLEMRRDYERRLLAEQESSDLIAPHDSTVFSTYKHRRMTSSE